MDGARLRGASEQLLSQPCSPSGTKTPLEAAGAGSSGRFSRLWCVLSVFASRLSLLLRSYSSARARTQTTAGPHWPELELETGRSQSEGAIAACALFPNTEHFVSEEGNTHIRIAVFDSCCCVLHGDSRGAGLLLCNTGTGGNSERNRRNKQKQWPYSSCCPTLYVFKTETRV